MSFSRREALTLLLGAPLALEACRRAPSVVPGAIRGAALPVGHRLRAPQLTSPSGPSERLGIAIVGSGIAGLSAAWRLMRAGEEDLTLFELEPQAGGTATYGTDGVAPYPWGAHYIPLPDPSHVGLVELLREAGALEPSSAAQGGAARDVRGKEEQLVREPEERLFVAGRWHEGLFPSAIAASDDLLQLERFNQVVERWVRFRDERGRRAFTLPQRRCSRAPEVLQLDTISAATFLDQHGITSPIVRWHAEYGCRDDYGLTLEQASAWALLFYFAARITEPGASSAPFLTWPEGNGRLVRHLRARLGSRLRTSQLVTELRPLPSGVELAVFSAETGETRRYLADRVIVAAPRFVTARILAPWRQTPPAWLAAFTYGAWLVANLHVKQRPLSVGAEPAWDNVIYASASLGYVMATHQQFRDAGPSVWTYYQPLTHAEPARTRAELLELSHAQCAEAVLTDLERAHPDLRQCVERLDVWRWGHAMIRPTPGFISSDARELAARPYERVHFAHSDLSGVALFEEAFDQGLRAAEEILAARQQRFESLQVD